VEGEQEHTAEACTGALQWAQAVSGGVLRRRWGMPGMMPEFLAQEKAEGVAREYLEESPPQPPHVRPDSPPVGPGGADSGALRELILGPRGLVVGILALMGLGLFIEVLRLWGARPRQKT